MSIEEKKRNVNYVYSTRATQVGVNRHPTLAMYTVKWSYLLSLPSFFFLRLVHLSTSTFALVFANSYHLAIWTGQHGTGWDCIRFAFKASGAPDSVSLTFFFCVFFFWNCSFYACRNRSEKEVSSVSCSGDSVKVIIARSFTSVQHVERNVYVCVCIK